MNRMQATLGGLIGLAGALLTTGAWADVARPDNGCPTVGLQCHNAGPAGEEDGVCTAVGCNLSGSGGGNPDVCKRCEVPSPEGSAGSGDDIPNTAGAANVAGAGSVAGAPNAAGAANAAGAPSAGGALNAGGAASHPARGAAGDTTTTGTDKAPDDGGCSVRMLGSEKGVAAMMLGLGAAALALSRRRR
jgi:hypothetical protein